jgi:hypothetical protein
MDDLATKGLARSLRREETTNQRNLYPIGVNVSKPLTADHGSPFFFTSSCRFRAVMSTAKAEWPKLTDSMSAETRQLHTVSRYVQVCILL